MLLRGLLTGAVCLAAAAQASDAKLVIAHRGASGYLPEHTLEAYAAAYAMGADYIEPDLVRSKDGRFVALHDIHLEMTTNVEERFPDRKRKDNRWYAIDFTLEELKTLRAEERLPNRFPVGQSDFEIPTLEEVIELVQGLNAATGRNVGIYPEMKAPSFHKQQGQPMPADLMEILRAYGYRGPNAKVFVQCFEHAYLEELRGELGCELPLIALLPGGRFGEGLATDESLQAIAQYANGIGPSKELLYTDNTLVKRAHAAGLKVHPYTVRRDQVPAEYSSTEEELRDLYFNHDVDGLFVDFPDDAVAVVNAAE